MTGVSSILVVDGTAICRDLLAAVLRLKGYETYTAADAREALGLLREHVPNLILLDLELSDMDGLALMRVVRSNPQYKGIHCIVLTSVSERECVLQARKLGAHDYLLKTHFSLENLLTRIAHALAKGSASTPAAGEAEGEPAVTQGAPT